MTHEHQETHDAVLISLRRIIRAIDLRSKNLAQHHGLTVPQLVVLQEVNRSGEVSAGQLAKNVSLSNATVTGILDRLAKRELVDRRRSGNDKRRVLVKLTGKGAEMLSKAPLLLQDRFVSEFSKLADWEQNLILSSLQRVAHMMEAKDLDAAPLLVSGEISGTTEAQKDPLL